MTPAEKLAKRKRPPRNCRGTAPGRKRVWRCTMRELRQSLRLAMHEVSKAVGMSMANMSELERGTDPQLSTARRLADFYGKTIEELWPERTEMNP